MSRVGVLGTPVWDRIFAAGAETPAAEGWGGIMYSLAALDAACPPGWEIVPFVKVGADLAAEARGFLRSLLHLAPGRDVRVVPEPTNRVELRYRDADRRCERLSGGIPGWRWAELEPRLPELDALYVNFISGFELALGGAERLRAGFPRPLYADLHSLFLDTPASGPRRLRPLPEWERWVRCFDAVQCNEDELAMLTGTPGDALRGAERLATVAGGLALVTLGGEGAVYALADPNPGPVHGEQVPAPEPAAGDPTGCGDVWGSTFFARRLAGTPLREAIEDAHRAAARNLGYRGVAGLREHLRTAARSDRSG